MRHQAHDLSWCASGAVSVFEQRMAIMGVHVSEFGGRKVANAARHELYSDFFLAAEPRLHAWTGVSKRRHVLTVHSLLGCPEMTDVVVVLARRSADGLRTPLHVSATDSSIGSLNLAEIRQRGALLDADEVHVYAAPSQAERAAVAADILATLPKIWSAGEPRMS
jgi:hypothetical protein